MRRDQVEPRAMKAFITVSAALGAVVTLAVVAPSAQAPQPLQAPQAPIDYNWDVRPILSDNCFRCHGNDEKARMAGLRLDQAESAYARRSGQQERFAIVPGRPDESELIRRITAPTVARRMPPAVTNKVLTPAQIEILRRWIEQGAQYKPHWAYITPAKTAAPPVDASLRPAGQRHRSVRARAPGARGTRSLTGGRQRDVDQPRQPDADRPAADARAGRCLRRPIRVRTPTSGCVDRLLASPAYARAHGRLLDEPGAMGRYRRFPR